jgi:hypothetical protein
MHGEEVKRFVKTNQVIVVYADGCRRVLIDYIMAADHSGHSSTPLDIEALKASGYTEDFSDLL